MSQCVNTVSVQRDTMKRKTISDGHYPLQKCYTYDCIKCDSDAIHQNMKFMSSYWRKSHNRPTMMIAITVCGILHATQFKCVGNFYKEAMIK